MFYRYTLSVSGEELNIEEIIECISTQVVFASIIRKGDAAKYAPQMRYPDSVISIWNPVKYSLGYNNSSEYDEWFVDLIERNARIFSAPMVEDLELFLDVFTVKEQCNFEILTSSLHRRISKYNVSIPISIHVMDEKEMLDFTSAEGITQS